MTAGGTREPIDPVRFVGNRSSGKQGYAVARVAAQRGAEVTLIAGHTTGLIDPAGVEVVHVSTAQQLDDAVSKHAPTADVLVMAAAVADFRPAQVSTAKIKKTADSPPVIELLRNDDVLAGAVRAREDGQLPRCVPSLVLPPRPVTPTGMCCFTPDRSCGEKAATCWSSTPWAVTGPLRWTTTTAGYWPPMEPRRRCSTGRRR